MYLSKYFLHRSVKLIQLWPLTRHICDKTRRGIWIAFHPPFMDDEWREHLISVTKKWRRPVLALTNHLCLCDPVSPFFSLGSTDRGKGQTNCKQALFFPSCIFFFFFFNLGLPHCWDVQLEVSLTHEAHLHFCPEVVPNAVERSKASCFYVCSY